ncbi:MAG TPA: hypothetical protein VFU97_09925 [Xanthobacteraceae bacterium]|jgi:hypothetical protein|nr:hypothetical protein [Xanthobacteraceae bacterium]
MDGSMLRVWPAFVVAGLALAGCSGTTTSLSNWNGGDTPPPAAAPAGPLPRPSLAAEDIVGRWGIASFHKPEDQARTEAAARSQCSQPYIINRSSDGVAMLGHDNPQVQDMIIKASAEGRTYIGPGPEPAGMDDREVVQFDGRVLVLKWVDPEVAGRYGIMVLVRCGAPGAPKSAKKKSG